MIIDNKTNYNILCFVEGKYLDLMLADNEIWKFFKKDMNINFYLVEFGSVFLIKNIKPLFNCKITITNSNIPYEFEFKIKELKNER